MKLYHLTKTRKTIENGKSFDEFAYVENTSKRVLCRLLASPGENVVVFCADNNRRATYEKYVYALKNEHQFVESLYIYVCK